MGLARAPQRGISCDTGGTVVIEIGHPFSGERLPYP
jgi:hypothetical protein